MTRKSWSDKNIADNLNVDTQVGDLRSLLQFASRSKSVVLTIRTMFELRLPVTFSLIVLILALLPTNHAAAVNTDPPKKATQEMQHIQFFDCACQNVTNSTSYHDPSSDPPDLIIRNRLPESLPNVAIKLWLETDTVTVTISGSDSKSKTTAITTTTLHPAAGKVETGNPKEMTNHPNTHIDTLETEHLEETEKEPAATHNSTPTLQSK